MAEHRPEYEALAKGGLINDVRTVMEWRPILEIIRAYKDAIEAPDKIRIAIDAVEFILDRLEGEGSMPAMRAIMGQMKHSMIRDVHARQLATTLADMLNRGLSPSPAAANRSREGSR